MTTKALIPIALLGLVFAVRTATAEKPQPAPKPMREPPRSPFVATIAGAGIIEASTENVSVGSAISGIVETVFVTVGDPVTEGQPLFVLDQRAQRATVSVRKAELLAAEKSLEKLRLSPRPESLPALEASLREAEARLEDAKVQLARWEKLVKENAVSQHEASLKRYAALVAERQVEHARAILAETKAGAWGPDLAVAEAQVTVARANLEQAQVELERLTVKAPVAARILKVNIRAGELIQSSTGAVILGDTEKMHVRVQIDESDVPRFRAGARGRASIKGLPEPLFELRFVKTEPFVLPKKSLTGQTNERVDTRVLEVVFAIECKPAAPIYVGQQVDAFIEETKP